MSGQKRTESVLIFMYIFHYSIIVALHYVLLDYNTIEQESRLTQEPYLYIVVYR